jgi:hypothetical protein
MMRQTLILAIVAASLFPTSSLSADWVSGVNEGTQGVHGAYAINAQDGLFDLNFSCMAFGGSNREVFMVLNTLPDAPLQPGNETQFPVTMSYAFASGSREAMEIDVEWQREESGINVWYARFPMGKAFLKFFGRSEKLELLSGSEGEVIFSYSMRGSAKAAEILREYCYSGSYD